MDLGNHIIAEVYDVPDYLTTNCDILERLLIKAAIDAKATVLHSYFHKLKNLLLIFNRYKLLNVFLTQTLFLEFRLFIYFRA